MPGEGLMTPEQAETAVWSFYYQVAHMQDRRAFLTPEQKAAQVAGQVEALQHVEGTLFGKITRFASKFFGDRARAQAVADATADARGELEAAVDKRGRVNAATGLPEAASDLATGRSAISGVDLAMELIVPPNDLAASCTHVLVDGGDEANDDDWQALAFRPKHVECRECFGRRRVRLPVTARIRTIDGCMACEACNGVGRVSNWKPEHHEAIRHNARVIAARVHELASEGYFDTKPINPRDTEMSDLTWEGTDGMTLGFRLTWKGWKRMQELCETRPDLRQMVHTLKYAGNEVRAQAPEWAQAQYRETRG